MIYFHVLLPNPLQVIRDVFVVAGPREAQGRARKVLINSQTESMLFTADGDQAVIGPDRLRVTGTPTAAACWEIILSHPNNVLK